MGFPAEQGRIAPPPGKCRGAAMCVPDFPPAFGGKSRRAAEAACWSGGRKRVRRYAVKGLVLGLTISRQSKSPRSRPWMMTSVVATLVA